MTTGTDDSRLRRLDELSVSVQDLRAGLQEVNRRIDQVNGRIDRVFLAMLGIGTAQIALLITLVIRGG
jgi:hypothetical protein